GAAPQRPPASAAARRSPPTGADRRDSAPRGACRAFAAAGRRSPLARSRALFGVDSSELAVVAILALIFIGPKDLPKVLRTVGYWVGRVRGMARHFTS